MCRGAELCWMKLTKSAIANVSVPSQTVGDNADQTLFSYCVESLLRSSRRETLGTHRNTLDQSA